MIVQRVLNCDTGELDPAALYADVTVTFAHPKVGLLRFPGAEAVGEIVVADIAIPAGLADDVPLEMATPQRVSAWLPERPRSAHKGTFGRAMLVAGSANYVGAAALAGAGAKRVGTGLVTMALPMPIQLAVAANLTEATYLLLPHDMGVVTAGAVQVLIETVEEYDALLLGPGLTQEKETVAFVHTLLGLERPERKGHMGFLSSSASEDDGGRRIAALGRGRRWPECSGSSCRVVEEPAARYDPNPSSRRDGTPHGGSFLDRVCPGRPGGCGPAHGLQMGCGGCAQRCLYRDRRS